MSSSSSSSSPSSSSSLPDSANTTKRLGDVWAYYNHELDVPPERPKTKISPWIPVSAFVATSLALAIPLFMVRRHRQVMRVALNASPGSSSTTAPPPRRVALSEKSAGLASLRRGPVEPTLHQSPTTNATVNVNSSTAADAFLAGDSDSAGLADVMSAMAKMNMASGMMALKAFGIATALVTIGTGLSVWGVMHVMGVRDPNEFGTRMRLLFSRHIPSLSTYIHRAPETPEERHHLPLQSPSSPSDEEDWSPAANEVRLRRAYEEGGVGLWAQVAMRVVEEEARIEREKRLEDIKLESGTT